MRIRADPDPKHWLVQIYLKFFNKITIFSNFLALFQFFPQIVSPRDPDPALPFRKPDRNKYPAVYRIYKVIGASLMLISPVLRAGAATFWAAPAPDVRGRFRANKAASAPGKKGGLQAATAPDTRMFRL